jgi:ABC-type bacteriocin/lantibiotic exporter with double-glycine peptidase domain
VLEVLSKAAGVKFDRLVAGRAVGETEQAISGGGASAWGRRLVDVGESVNLRIRSVQCTMIEALAFVRQGTPAAFCREEVREDQSSKDSRSDNLRWYVMSESKGRRIRVLQPNDRETESWMTVRKLQKTLGVESTTAPARWIIGQAALGCQTPNRYTSGTTEEPVSPFWRLIGLMQPEKKDIWVVLIFSLVVGVLALATPVAVEALVNTVAFGQYLQPVIILALLLFTFLAFAAAMRGLIAYVVEIFQRRLFIRIVEDLAYRLPRVQQEQFDKKHGPEAVNRFFEVASVQKAASSLLLDGLSIVLQTAAGMIVLAFYHPFLLGFNVVLLFLILFTVFGLGRGAVRTAIKESKAKYEIAAWLEEVARHPTAFKLHAGNAFALDRADQLAIHWLDMRRSHFRVIIRQILFALGIQALAATALLGLGGWLVILGELTLGQLVAAELIVMMIISSFAKLGKHLEAFYDLLASMDKLGQLFDLEVEAHDKLFHLREGEPAALSVRGVTYTYGGTHGIANCDLELAPGETVALTGAAGSGKSTLFDLICGLRSPSSGHIELDGIDLRELRPDSLREHLAVARSVEIFHGTIDENVHLNRPNVRANDVRDALETVGLLDEVLKLPEGLNAVLQTNGAPLTQSQAVRLMVARAIVGRPRLLLIDGTLDGLSDHTLERVLARLTNDDAARTTLVATGRSKVMKACDRVFSLGADSADQSTEVALS